MGAIIVLLFERYETPAYLSKTFLVDLHDIERVVYVDANQNYRNLSTLLCKRLDQYRIDEIHNCTVSNTDLSVLFNSIIVAHFALVARSGLWSARIRIDNPVDYNSALMCGGICTY